MMILHAINPAHFERTKVCDAESTCFVSDEILKLERPGSSYPSMDLALFIVAKTH
jgi:hypothetical protein